MRVAIIGAGASGIACAIELKSLDKNVSVTVLERLPRILKKLLVTGNGRCNILNKNSSPEYYRGDRELLSYVLKAFSVRDNEEFFKKIGIPLFEESEGRMYPVSQNAASVVNALLFRAKELGIEIITDYAVKSIKKEKDGFLINSEMRFDRVVLSSGGCSAKVHGSDGSSFRLLDLMGVKTVKPYPALTGVISDGFPKALKGIRHTANIKLYSGKNLLYSETGEIQFNDYGLSGIPVMQLSGLLRDIKKNEAQLILDCAHDISRKELEDYLLELRNSHPDMPAQTLLSGLLPKALTLYILRLCGISPDTAAHSVKGRDIEALCDKIKGLVFPVSRARDFDFSQVTSGGAGIKEINPETLEVRKIKGLYVSGEALNIDGLCGGHNLNWAWSSGRFCAHSLLKENKIDKNK